MTKVYEGKEFEGFFDGRSILPFRRWSGRVFEDMTFRRCRFVGCTIAAVRSPKHRTVVRNVEVVRCEQAGCHIGSVVAEEVFVDGLKSATDIKTWGAVFKHVTLTGRLGALLISPLVAPWDHDQTRQRLFEEANARYYESVDWALDISEAIFTEADIRGVPARLIRRDPETQMVITREKALEGVWRELDLRKTYWQTSIEFMLNREDQDTVLVCPKAAVGEWNYRDLLEGLRLLSEAGVAEPD